jgi:hypothetical protein
VTQNPPIREKLLVVDDDFRLSEMLRDYLIISAFPLSVSALRIDAQDTPKKR